MRHGRQVSLRKCLTATSVSLVSDTDGAVLIREPVASGVWQTAKSGFVVVAMGLNGKPDR